jgi:AcrR family transcriptional regulator
VKGTPTAGRTDGESRSSVAGRRLTVSITSLFNNGAIASSRGKLGESSRHPRRRPERKRVVTRQRILDSAEKLFLAKGFAATTVQDIAVEAGYTTGAIYSSFGGKAHLIAEVVRRRTDFQRKVWQGAIEPGSTPSEAALAMGTALREATFEPEWYAALFEFFSFTARHPTLREEMVGVLGDINPLMVEVLGGVSASSPLPLERLAPVVAALMRGLAWTWVVDPDGADVTLFSDGVAVLLGARPPAVEGPSDQRRSAS